MSPKINRRQITEFAIAAGVLSSSQSARAFAFSIFGPQVDMDKTSRRSNMPETQTQYPPLPPDDLNRKNLEGIVKSLSEGKPIAN